MKISGSNAWFWGTVKFDFLPLYDGESINMRSGYLNTSKQSTIICRTKHQPWESMNAFPVILDNWPFGVSLLSRLGGGLGSLWWGTTASRLRMLNTPIKISETTSHSFWVTSLWSEKCESMQLKQSKVMMKERSVWHMLVCFTERADDIIMAVWSALLCTIYYTVNFLSHRVTLFFPKEALNSAREICVCAELLYNEPEEKNIELNCKQHSAQCWVF